MKSYKKRLDEYLDQKDPVLVDNPTEAEIQTKQLVLNEIRQIKELVVDTFSNIEKLSSKLYQLERTGHDVDYRNDQQWLDAQSKIAQLPDNAESVEQMWKLDAGVERYRTWIVISKLNHLRNIIDGLMDNNALMHINAHIDQILSDSKSVLTYSEDPTEPPF